VIFAQVRLSRFLNAKVAHFAAGDLLKVLENMRKRAAANAKVFDLCETPYTDCAQCAAKLQATPQCAQHQTEREDPQA
jgi:hypothetical protein